MNNEKYTVPAGSLISFFSNKVKMNGGINLAQGIPGYAPPTELLQLLSEISLQKNIHQYAPGVGNFKLIDQICANYQSEMKLKPEQLLIVQGATEAVTLIYTYLKTIVNGTFSVFAFDPVYETYNNLPAIFGDDFHTQSYTSDNEIDFDLFEKNIQEYKVNLLFMNSPGNPFGRVFKQSEVEKILSLSKKYGFYIIFDAVYRDLYFSEKPYIPYPDQHENLFYVNSFSKKLSITGWRVGYFICSQNHMKRLRSIHDYTGLCVASVLQETIASFLVTYNYGETYTIETRNKIINAYKLYKPFLEGKGFKVPESGGGYFIWAKLPENFTNDFVFAIDLYEQQNVAIIPGQHFSPGNTKFVRFNLAREEFELKQGIESISAFLAH